MSTEAPPAPVEEQPKTSETTKLVEEPPKTSEATQPVEETKTLVDVPLKPKKEMNLIEIIMDYLKVEDGEIVLTPEVKKLLEKAQKIDKTHFDNIETFFTQIMKDKKIDTRDLPALIGLVQELFTVYEALKSKIKASDVGTILKCIFQLLILYKFDGEDYINKEEKENLIASIDTIIVLCIQMIDLKDNNKKLRKWFRFLPCF